MTTIETEIVTELLDTIRQSNVDDRPAAILMYRDFLDCISCRMSIEAQQVENERNRNT